MPRFLASLLPLLFLVACGRSVTPSVDQFSAFNDGGGCRRSNDFSSSETDVVADLYQIDFKGLEGGLRTPPLELGDGTIAVMVNGSLTTPPSIARVFGDSVAWRVQLPSGWYPLPGLAADSATAIYVASTAGRVWALSRNGSILWYHQVAGTDDGGHSLPTTPLALADGVVVGDDLGNVIRLDAGGKVVWRVRRGGAFNARPCGDPRVGLVAGLTHNAYGQRDTLVVLDPGTGGNRWSQPLTGRIVAEPIVTGSHVAVGTVSLDTENRQIPRIEVFDFRGNRSWDTIVPLIPRGIAGTGEGDVIVSCAGSAVALDGGAVVAFDSAGHRLFQVPLGSPVTSAVLATEHWIYFVARREGRTGLYTYDRSGTFAGFVSIDVLPDVLTRLSLSSLGQLVLSGLDEPTILVGG